MTYEHDAMTREPDHPALPEPEGRLRPQGLDQEPEVKTTEPTRATAERRPGISAHFLLDGDKRVDSGRAGTSSYLVVKFHASLPAADVQILVSKDTSWISPRVLHGRELAYRINPAMTTSAANRLMTHTVAFVDSILQTTPSTETFDAQKVLRTDKGRNAQKLIETSAQLTWIQP